MSSPTLSNARCVQLRVVASAWWCRNALREVMQTAARSRTTVRIVSWLPPNWATRARRLLVPASARIALSCSRVSLRARARDRRLEGESQFDPRGGATEELRLRSGNGMRDRPSEKLEDAEAIPVASALSTLTVVAVQSVASLGPQLTAASDNGQWLRGRRSKRGAGCRSTRRDTDSRRQSRQKRHNSYSLTIPVGRVAPEGFRHQSRASDAPVIRVLPD